MNKKINELITKAKVAIKNGKDHPVAAAMLQEFGYTSDRLNEGNAFLNEAVTKYSNHIKEDGEQQAATKELTQAIEEANKLYIPLLKVARITFKNDTNQWIKLELQGKRKRSQSGWLTQTKLFYTNLLDDEEAMARMAVYGRTKEKLEEAYLMVQKAEEKLAIRKKEMGKAQNAKKLRDKAVDQLQAWYTDYIEIAKVAMARQPQYLEMLGIISPS